MNLSELKAKLEGNNVPKDMYHFGWTTNETICIEYRNGGWEVYSSERGSKILIKRFKRENYACEYFYKAVMNDYRQYQEYILHYKINNLRPLLERPYRDDDLFYRDDMASSHSKEEWERIQAEHNIKFPLDYIDYINAYGLGAVGGFLWIYSPWSNNDSLNLFAARPKALEGCSPFCVECLVSTNSSTDCLVPLGRTDNDDYIFWLKTDNEQEQWHLILCDGHSTKYFEYAMSITEFLAGIIRGTVQCDLLPDEWIGAGHLDFIPYKNDSTR
ncbi:SMI1/KNR4 family protein [Selenomonas ruminantium]|uniref:SMI1 / KNR4 family (SUKH-1) n=1 Tax=Selenomonas ruminantium TaxID=971 RepID=A0A1H3VEH0_SELRU|nr:SMI1/KNR4 family protein [Selenomonas ruminantium]SDZ72568.1 SMI1 / KNR4 family (SUKH-1) [Selenomonas ruminantium]